MIEATPYALTHKHVMASVRLCMYMHMRVRLLCRAPPVTGAMGGRARRGVRGGRVVGSTERCGGECRVRVWGAVGSEVLGCGVLWAVRGVRVRGAVGGVDYRGRHGGSGPCRRTATGALARYGADAGARAVLARRAAGIDGDGRHHALPRLPHGSRALSPLTPKGCGVRVPLGIGCVCVRGGAGCQLIIREIPDTSFSVMRSR